MVCLRLANINITDFILFSDQSYKANNIILSKTWMNEYWEGFAET